MSIATDGVPNEIYSVQVVFPTETPDGISIASQFKPATGTLNIPAKTAISYRDGLEDLKKLAINHRSAVEYVKAELLRCPERLSVDDFDFLYKDEVEKPFVEKRGTEAGTKWRRGTFVSYLAKNVFSADSFVDGIELVPVSYVLLEIDKATARLPAKELSGFLDGGIVYKDRNLNLGIIRNVEEIRKKHPDMLGLKSE